MRFHLLYFLNFKALYMKKYFNSLGVIFFLLICTSFIHLGPKKYKESDRPSIKKRDCICGTPTNLQANRSGGIVHVQWSAATNAMSYSVGGYKSSCSPPVGFNYCATNGATSIDIPSTCAITVKVTAVCDVSDCENATCVGGTAGPVASN